MRTLLTLFACGAHEAQTEPSHEFPPCATAEHCHAQADAAAEAGMEAFAFVSTSDGCDLGDESLCIRLASIYMDASGPRYNPTTGESVLLQSCERKHFPACVALGDYGAAKDDVINAEMWYHKGCELGNVPLCVRSAAYAVEVQKQEVGLTALPDAVHACEQGDVPSCHAAITIAGGVGPPAGQDLEGFTQSMLQRACVAGEAASCSADPTQK